MLQLLTGTSESAALGHARSNIFKRPPSLTVGEIVSLTGAEAVDADRLTHRICNVAPLDLAGPTDLSFIDSGRYVDMLALTRAGACLMSERFEARAPRGLIVLRTREPYRAFVTVQRKMFPAAPAAVLTVREQTVLRRAQVFIPWPGSRAV